MEDTILSEKLLNPEASLRDIAKEANVSHQTVDNVLDKAPELLTSIDT
ncbi:LacI family DNA-binding transcriptional regulator [Candidatus Dependentiae bacterium]|nr:MAG: LacI family DNA-binding transcriptional regulator [Candidatus Dependentiae bacterium]